MTGFVNVNKPSGMTSSKVVTLLKKRFNVKKIGHMGTLDPLAEGVLPIAIGKATRMFDFFLEKKKTYIAQFTFGETTDTLDSEGKVTEVCDYIPNKSQVESVLSKLIGRIAQIPPQFSAKKVNGRCAYDFARLGQTVELKPKEIEIYDIKLLNQISSNVFEFEIECSGGTYIRSIARDMADELGSKAYMSKLIRTKSGKFEIEKSYTLQQLEALQLNNVIVNIEDVFDYNAINLSEQETKNLLDGKILNIDKNNGQYFVKCDKILIGIGDVNNSILKLKTYLREE